MNSTHLRRRVFLFLLIISNVVLWAQPDTIFAPYVSDIRTFSQAESIRLSWKNSPDIDGDLYIFRHTKEISTDTFKDAVPIARVSSSAAEFTDHPGDTREYFYLILGSNLVGDLYEYIIPFRNASTLGVSAQQSSQPVSTAVNVSGLHAQVENDSIVLVFSSSRDDMDLIIYRHTDPIAAYEDIIEATRVSIVPSSTSRYVDYPIPDITYYYAVQDAQMIKTGNADFVFGENTLENGVRIPVAASRTGLAPSSVYHGRKKPLPYLLLTTEVSSGRTIQDSLSLLSPQQQSLSSETTAAVRKIVQGVSEYKSRITKPAILDPETGSELIGEEYTLRQIIKDRLITGQYEEGIHELSDFLSLKRSKELNYRGRFYLGQMYYLSGHYQKAFLEFLIAEERFYPQVKPWLEDIYYIFRSQIQ